jgi:hypothetical protein
MDPVTEKWKSIEVDRHSYPRGARVDGIPFPVMFGGILMEAWLLGEAQAQALAWEFAANYAATHYNDIEVRIISFDVKYSIDYEPTLKSDE